METKYIRHEKQGFILWPRVGGDPVWHRHMARFVVGKCDGGEILSAGSVRFVDGKPECYGMSESLKLRSKPEDSELLAQQLGIAFA